MKEGTLYQNTAWDDKRGKGRKKRGTETYGPSQMQACEPKSFKLKVH